MARAKTSKGTVAPGPAPVSSTSTSAMTAVPGQPNELQVLGMAMRQWAEERELRKQWDSETARVQSQSAANMIGAPAISATVRTYLVAHLAQLSDIEVAIEGGATKYSWGSFLSTVNSAPYSAYFGATQANDSIVEKGAGVAVATGTSNPAGWGNVVFNILDIGYSSRFGGSFCVTLTPKEDCGLELLNAAKKIALDLNRWVLRLYVQGNASLFNTPPNPYIPAALLPSLSCEIEVNESEAYEVSASGNLIANSTNVLDADVQAMIRQAEDNARARLDKLARFVLGWVHDANIPAFNRTVERVDRVHVSDGSCNFELSAKTPSVAVKLKVGYLFLAEGFGESERELTAEPWMQGRTPPLVVFSYEKSKYIGNAKGTGWLTMGYVAPSDLARVHEITVFPLWREDDPISDDTGGGIGQVFNVAFDSAAINQRIAAQQPGQIGQDMFAIANDPIEDWTSYSFEIRFELFWR